MSVTFAECIVPLPCGFDLDNVNRVEVRGREFVAIVRCKDCVHYFEDGCGNTNYDSPAKRLLVVKPDWFCADGVRSEKWQSKK